MKYITSGIVTFLFFSWITVSHGTELKSQEFAQKENRVNIAWSQVLTVHQRQIDLLRSFIRVLKNGENISSDLAQYLKIFEKDIERTPSIMEKKLHEIEMVLSVHTRSLSDFGTLLHTAQKDAQFAQVISEYFLKLREITEITAHAEASYDQAAEEFNCMIKKFPNNMVAFINGIDKTRRLPSVEVRSATQNEQM